MLNIVANGVKEIKRMSKNINIIFPHQLFSESVLLENGYDVYLIEEFLFFKQYKFHKQKLAFHRASMKFYQSYLESIEIKVHYIDCDDKLSDIRKFKSELKKQSVDTIHVLNPTDDWLERRLRKVATNREIQIYDDPQFLNTPEDLSKFFRSDKKSFFQTSFYKQQRKKRSILMTDDEKPEGGKWTYDSENRKKYPKKKMPPAVNFPSKNKYWDEAIDYVENKFSDNPGQVPDQRFYPITHQESSDWLDQFLKIRFFDFGVYEDAIVQGQSILNHSVLSPLINVGLIQVQEVLDRSLAFAEEEGIPINSTEGFVRQIIGWREFIRGMYLCKGRSSRTHNFWKFKRKIPSSFYDGTTGILPIDHTIQKILKTGYCHHIERLMILGNFMLLCAFDPDEVYRWFMELFIDAYDWVMVPNVYGMCLYADGGTFATKPYIGGSNYIRKMSNFPKGEWEEIWDGMFWNFISENQDFFRSNPRTSMLVYMYDKMSDEKRQTHIENAKAFIKDKLEAK